MVFNSCLIKHQNEFSHPSHSFRVFFLDPPGPPTRVTPSDVAKDAVTLTWFEPDEDGGSPISGYWIEKFDPESDKWIRCNKLPIKDTTFR